MTRLRSGDWRLVAGAVVSEPACLRCRARRWRSTGTPTTPSRPAPRLADGVRQLGHLLHPEAVPDPGLPAIPLAGTAAPAEPSLAVSDPG